jgi:hypothetical protein
MTYTTLKTVNSITLKTVISLLLLLGGLFIALSDNHVFFKPPVAAVVVAIPPKSLGEERVVTMTLPPEKSWMDYGDKIVGWIVALCGAYSLVRRTKNNTKVM